MKRSASILTFAIALFFGAAKAKAEPIQWGYNWTPNHTTLFSDTDPSSTLKLTNELLAYGEGSSDTVITNITASSLKPGNHPDSFFAGSPNGDVTFSLTLYDGPDAAHPGAINGSNTFAFSGNFSGTLSGENIHIRFKPNSPLTITKTVGFNVYTVSLIDPDTGAFFYTPPTIPNAKNNGSLSAFVSVRPADIQKVPEPSTMALSCVGLCALGLRTWRKRRQVVTA